MDKRQFQVHTKHSNGMQVIETVVPTGDAAEMSDDEILAFLLVAYTHDSANDSTL